MQNFFIALLICSTSMSVIALFYMAITPLLTKRYSVKWRYYAWLIIVIGLIIPFRPHFDTAIITVDMPAEASTPIVQTWNGTPDATPSENAAIPPASPSITWEQIAAAIWLAGVIVVFAYHAIRHYRFMKMVGRWSKEVTDARLLGILHSLADQMGISAAKVLESSCIPAPMMVGFITPVILLPKTDFHDNELAFILKHELVHFKRKDLWYKCLVLAASAIHWFNPAVYLMAKEIGAQCELSCDEEVLRSEDADTRQQYSETIIGVIRNQYKVKTALSTNFYGGKKGMKKRIFSIMDTTKKKAGFTILCSMLILTLSTGMAFAASASDNAHNKNANTEFVASPLSEVKIGDSIYKANNGEAISSSKKITFDIATIKNSENVKLGDYTLHRGDTVQIEYEHSGSEIGVFIFAGGQNTRSQAVGEKITIGTVYTIPQDGDYYFSINSANSSSIKGTITFNYQTPRITTDEKIQFTDDKVPSDERQSSANAKPLNTTNPMPEAANGNKSPYDGMFDDKAVVLEYYNKKSYTADNYQETLNGNEASFEFTNFSGSKVIYEFDFAQATTVDFRISADADGEYKVAFITGNNDIIMTASTYDWFPASKPIEFPKGVSKVVLIAEQATGGCNIALYH